MQNTGRQVMMQTTVSGWLFDIYASPQGVTLWLIDREGRKHMCTAPFVPSFYLEVDAAGGLHADGGARAADIAVAADADLCVVAGRYPADSRLHG